MLNPEDVSRADGSQNTQGCKMSANYQVMATGVSPITLVKNSALSNDGYLKTTLSWNAKIKIRLFENSMFSAFML